MALLRCSALAATALTLVLTSAAPAALASPAGDTSTPCPTMSTAQAAGQTVPTCEAFYGSGAAIKVPADTTTVVYGLLNAGTLQTRSGDFPASSDAWQPYETAFGLLVRARIVDGAAVYPRPVVLVRQRPVLQPLLGTHARAAVEWMSPPAGVQDGTAVLAFTSRTSATVLNYHRAARIDGRCVPGLATTNATKAAYAPYLDSGTLEVYWTPGMHSPTDSEIVMDSPSGPSWMTPGPQLLDLLGGPWKPTKVDFRIHANPIGTPATIAGTIKPGATAQRC